MEKFLLATKEVRFGASRREEVYGWVERLLYQQEHARQGRRAQGLLRRNLTRYLGQSQWANARWLPTGFDWNFGFDN